MRTAGSEKKQPGKKSTIYHVLSPLLFVFIIVYVALKRSIKINYQGCMSLESIEADPYSSLAEDFSVLCPWCFGVVLR